MGSTPPFRDVLPTPTLLRLLKHLDEEARRREAAEEDLRPVGRCTGATPRRAQGLVSVLPGSQVLFQDEEEERNARQLQARGLWAMREIRELTLGAGPAAGTQSPSESSLNSLQQAEDTALGHDGTLAAETSSPQKEAPFLYLGLPTMPGSSSIRLDEEQTPIQSPRAALACEEPTTSSTSVSQQIGQISKVTETTSSHVTFAPGLPVTHGPPPEAAEWLPAPSFSRLRKVGASASQLSFRPSPSGLPQPPGPRPAFPRLTKRWGQSRGSSPGFLVLPCLAAGGDEDAGDDGVSDMVVDSLDDKFRGPLMHTQGGGSSDIMKYTQDGGLSDLMGDIEDGGSSVLLEDTEDGSSSDLMGDTEDGGSSVLLADSQDGGSSDLMGDTEDGGSCDFMGDTQDGSSSDLMGDTEDGGSSDIMGECQDSYSCVGLVDSQGGGSMAVNQDGEGSHLLANLQDSSSDSQEGESAGPLEVAQDEACRKGGQSGGLVLAGPAELGNTPASPEHELPLAMEEPEAGPSQLMGPVAQPDMQDVYTELQRDMFYKAFLFHKFMRLGSPQQEPGHQQAKEHP